MKGGGRELVHIFDKAAIEACGAKCITICANVTDEAQVEGVQKFGHVDLSCQFHHPDVFDADTAAWNRVSDGDSL
ncbi:hypothetical protein Q7P35_005695 [Cladosporium inversicolor]